MTKQDVFNRLIIIAANGIAGNTYRDGDVLKSFCQLPLPDLADFWSNLTSQTKLAIIDNHQDEFIAWANSQRGEK
jgi:hypothetical protein